MKPRGIRAAAWAVALVAVLGFGGALAQEVSPQAFLEAIYRPYAGKDFKGTRIDTPTEVRRYFDTPLAAAILKDRAAAAKRNEVPDLDGDPFIDAQDWEIAGLNIMVKTTGAKRATGTVTFTNARQPKTVTLDLVKTAAGWRIAEIRAPSGSLRKLMKLR